MKKIISLLLVLCMTIGISACGSKQEEAPEAPSAEAGQEQVETPSEEEQGNSEQGSYELIFVCPLIGLEYWICAQMVLQQRMLSLEQKLR